MQVEQQLVDGFIVNRAKIWAALNPMTAYQFIVHRYCVGFDRRESPDNYAIENLAGYQILYNLVRKKHIIKPPGQEEIHAI